MKSDELTAKDVAGRLGGIGGCMTGIGLNDVPSISKASSNMDVLLFLKSISARFLLAFSSSFLNDTLDADASFFDVLLEFEQT